MENPTLNFVVVEKNGFIARDMMAGFSAADPGCRVQQVENIDDLAARAGALFPAGLRHILITKLSLADVQDRGLADLAARHGCTLVLREGADPLPDFLPHGWHRLPTPFVEDDLHDLVATLRATDLDQAAAQQAPAYRFG